MQLTQTAQYALRVVAHMARHSDEEPFRSSDLSDATSVPPHYISKLMRRLVETGILESQRGHGGGYRLARPTSQISFYDVIEAVDETVVPAQCVFGWDRCGWDDPCPLHPYWSRLKEQYSAWARNHTMDDVRLDVE